VTFTMSVGKRRKRRSRRIVSLSSVVERADKHTRRLDQCGRHVGTPGELNRTALTDKGRHGNIPKKRCNVAGTELGGRLSAGP